MALRTCTVGSIVIGPAEGPVLPGRAAPTRDLVLIAGPCVLEDEATNRTIFRHLAELCRDRHVPLVLKASFDKANRSSIRSPRGPGLEAGLAELAALGREFGAPTTTDVHEPGQAEAAAESVDLLQVPAFLCRQTDLLLACAATGRPVNVKKGQFLSPAEMTHVLAKLDEGGAAGVMLTERGTFFGYQRLVNDFIGLGDLMDLGRPVCFDVTHSTQLPGAGAGVTAGRPDRAALLARTAAAAGVHALFVECHPDPARARSDGATQQPLDAMAGLLDAALAVHRAATGAERDAALR